MAHRQMSNERMGRIVAGASVVLVVALGAFHHPLWYLVLVGISINLVVSGITNRCPVRTLLIHLGFPPERDLGKRDAFEESQSLPRPQANVAQFCSASSSR